MKRDTSRVKNLKVHLHKSQQAKFSLQTQRKLIMHSHKQMNNMRIHDTFSLRSRTAYCYNLYIIDRLLEEFNIIVGRLKKYVRNMYYAILVTYETFTILVILIF